MANEEKTNVVVDDTPIEKLAFAKRLFLTLAGCMLAGIVLLFIGVAFSSFLLGSWLLTIMILLGYAVYAAPCLLAFVFKVGIFADIGPMFM